MDIFKRAKKDASLHTAKIQRLDTYLVFSLFNWCEAKVSKIVC